MEAGFDGDGGVLELAEGDAGLFEEGGGDGTEGVVAAVDDFGDAGVDDGFGAVGTGGEGAIEGAAADGDAVGGGLDDGVFLGMDAEAFVEGAAAGGVAGAAGAAAVAAIGDALGGAVVAGGEDLAVTDDNGADAAAEAVAAGGGDFGHHHEVFVPGGPGEEILDEAVGDERVYFGAEGVDSAGVVEAFIGEIAAGGHGLGGGVALMGVQLAGFPGAEFLESGGVAGAGAELGACEADALRGVDENEDEVDAAGGGRRPRRDGGSR